ncbi:helix-turn-helix transcriptional regulator [Actinoplanes sp. Pm04-4]|uniref:Helix-turn-helix transcriptional regulator n=1 Tax=Paractinoplanes pyxinae TaxID=2997416 RepID=A0ABT4B4H0_9ACTN|nr:helix-turn-helix transcriptional regulator [Actinoplanes pyxinae]MCY1141365.1 helix-turn-helix transcriptional regulator [Actinoplanes pyxinae]
MTGKPERITAPFLDVLEVFLAAIGDELHGWAIIKASSRGGPTVYKILERLEGMGWVTARWEERASEPNRPRRRYYKLTGDGAAGARELISARRPRPSRISIQPAFGGTHL